MERGKLPPWVIQVATYAGIAYALYWFVTSGLPKIAGSAAKALTDAGGVIGGKLYDVFHPNTVGESLFYTVTFPNGARHSIPSSQVNARGQFSYVVPPLAATRWQIVIDKAGFKKALPL